jgi:uncharacterized protein (DUF736 family)
MMLDVIQQQRGRRLCCDNDDKGGPALGRTPSGLSIRAEIAIVPVGDKASPNQPDYRVMSQGIEIGAGWVRKGQTSGKEYVSLSIAAPEFGAKTLYANLGRAAGQSDPDVYALIWSPQD